jgi:hypothetical protein
MAVQYAFGKIVTQGLDLNVDAADPTSYPGSGTSWTSVVNRSITGSLVSCSFSSDFKGGIVFNNPSASVEFPGTVANYGTGSFTIEMAFRPSSINGIHYLVSKNSGSFPNWGVYLSGSGGQGKLFAEYRINASVSCSVESFSTFQTGSFYQVDIVLASGFSGSTLYINGQSETGNFGNGGGSLTTTSSLFVGNQSQSSLRSFSGSLYFIRTYSTSRFTLPVVNYNTVSTRFSKPPVPDTLKKQFEILIVAGGGSSGYSNSGGGGAGGLQVVTTRDITSNSNTIIVGAGGSTGNGRNSSFLSYESIGGGIGGGDDRYAPGPLAGSGGSGGGASTYTTIPGTGIPGQGNGGGLRSSDAQRNGGGGGAGTPGGNADNSKAGDGGAGLYIESFAVIGGSPSGWFAGGGAGGVRAGGIGFGGIGGGGNSFDTGSRNTGGGGGGVDNNSPSRAGGSGIVAIRYSGGPIAIGGEITQSAGFTYHVFKTVGTSSFTIF